ncbi:MAG: OmpW family outer membrane protein [Steroidobacter sp.]
MKKMNKFSRNMVLVVSLTLASLFCIPSAWSADVPSNSIRIGFYDVFYHTSADDLQGPYVPSGVNVNVRDVQTLYLAYVRRLNADWDFEFAFGVPPKTETEGKGPATLGSVPYNKQVISTAKWFAPTVLFNYNLLDESHKFRPYIGAGINYTTFYDRRSTAAGDAASGGPTKISLSRSIGPAATAGLSYKPAPNWGVYVSYSITRVNSHLTTNTAGVIRETNIKFGPQALVVSVGYAF